MKAEELSALLHDAMEQAERQRIIYAKQKMELSWNEYQKVIEGFLHKILNHCKLIEDYEDKTACNHIYDFINEDNFYIRYFCKYLENEMKQWQKKYYGVRVRKKYKRCQLCGALIENTGSRKMYCSPCARKQEAVNARQRKRKQRERAQHKKKCHEMQISGFP